MNKILKFTLFKKIKSRLKFNKPVGNNLTVLEDDIFIVSYPRSGNTWLRFLLGTLLYGEKVDWLNIERIIPDIYINSNKDLLKINRPRILKSHQLYDKRYNKVIYLVRDVRDVAISFYYFRLKTDSKFIKSFDEFILYFAEEKLATFGTWGENVQSWLDNKDKVKNGFFLMKYEDLMCDTYKEILKILEFLKIKKTQKKVKEAINWTSFNNMKKLEKNQEKYVRIFKNTNLSIPFVRKGVINNWKTQFSKKHIQIYNKHCNDLLIKLGYFHILI